MASTLNKVTLIGHLGDDVKIHYFEGGDCVARFPLATHETYTNKTTQEKNTYTEWHNIVVRNKAAELCEKYLSKGDKIYVEGKIRTRHWQTDDGTQKHTTEIVVQEFMFLQTKKSELAKVNNPIDEKKSPITDVPKINPNNIEDQYPF